LLNHSNIASGPDIHTITGAASLVTLERLSTSWPARAAAMFAVTSFRTQ